MRRIRGWGMLRWLGHHGGVLAMCLSASTVVAAPQVFESEARQSQLVELYTSEGCNSCPPAETFLNSLAESPQLWRGLIPVAFHVDYWDYIGWRDRFAHPSYGQRQAWYASTHRVRTVYTPAWFINGESWRPSLFYRQLPEQGAHETGRLRVIREGERVSAEFLPLGELGGSFMLHLVLLGRGLESQIAAGENRGRHARHDFVVANYVTSLSSTRKWLLALPTPRFNGSSGYALAAWVSREDSPVPLQAVGGMLN